MTYGLCMCKCKCMCMADVNICKKDTNARVEHLRQIQFLKVTGFRILAFFLVITVLLRAKTTNSTTHNPKPSTFSIIQQSKKLKKQKKIERGDSLLTKITIPWYPCLNSRSNTKCN